MLTKMFQVASPRGGDLVDVKIPEGYILVLTGYTLEHATCGNFRAARHHVVSRAYQACQHVACQLCFQRPAGKELAMGPGSKCVCAA